MHKKIQLSAEEQENIEQIIFRYDGLLNKFSHLVYRRCAELDFKDIKQTLILRMVIAYRQFDHTQPDKEFSFFYQVLANESNLLIRKYYSPRNKIHLSLVSLDEFLDEEEKTTYHSFLCDEETAYYNPEVMYSRKILQEKIEECYLCFSKQEKEVFDYYQQGKSIAEIAVLLSKSKKTIYNTMNRIKFKIKSKMEN